ncbi:phytoene desaturase family protein [Rhodococcus sp. OK302]|uniref:phytoene desaturase family protein n=1 Tax=Rhodococcus sp. OK302 TaxID=1882769 RepID=UPI000B93EB0D|nr:phytoene desaturase family protein [Rhodococcus sp. OK302]
MVGHIRTVSAPTDHVVIVGAGLAGLSAGLHLLGAGRAVTILEADATVGGRVGRYCGPDYTVDNGATVLTMPQLIDEALAAVGAHSDSTTPKLVVHKLDPAYHARFADGTTLDVSSDPDTMAAEVSRLCGPDEARRYRSLRRWLAQIFDAEFDRFMDANFDSPLDLVNSSAALKDLSKLLALRGFGSLGHQVDRFIRDPRLRRIFTFQALYAGVAPARALAVYGAIAHMDTSLGVYFPEGGMHTIAASMADAFTTSGGKLRLDTPVERLETTGRRVSAVLTTSGERLSCDALVLTPDVLVTDQLLRPHTRRRPRRVRTSPSAVVIHGTILSSIADRWPANRHHTIDFGDAWERTFAEITAGPGRGTLMSDPSLLITRPAVTDAGLTFRRDGRTREPLSILAPCPNLVSAPLDWSKLETPYVREILGTLQQRGYDGLADGLDIDHVDTPRTWLDKGMTAGSPFAAAHTFSQTGPFRRKNLEPGFDNVVLAGSGTVPGVGVPTVLLSGRLAAERITGARNRGEAVLGPASN